MTRKENVLYLREMGMNDYMMPGDIQNHRVRVIENIDIIYKGEKYNMFFEFLQGVHWHYRKENKRNGSPLKKPVYEVDVANGLFIDTQFERVIDGFEHSFRKSDFEREMWEKHMNFTSNSILYVVNKYKVGPAFDRVVLIERAAADIIRKNGGWRELDILNENKDFRTLGDSYFTIGDTWNEDHKIMRCNKRVWVPCDGGRKLDVVDFCEVDLITGHITG